MNPIETGEFLAFVSVILSILSGIGSAYLFRVARTPKPQTDVAETVRTAPFHLLDRVMDPPER